MSHSSGTIAYALYDIEHGGSKQLIWPGQHVPTGDPAKTLLVPLVAAPNPTDHPPESLDAPVIIKTTMRQLLRRHRIDETDVQVRAFNHGRYTGLAFRHAVSMPTEQYKFLLATFNLTE